MQTKQIGQTDIQTSVLGIGGNKLLDAEDKETLATMHEAIDRGITHIDSSEFLWRRAR